MGNMMIAQSRFKTWHFASSRILDLVSSALGLVVLAPFLCLIALVIKLTSSGPALYRARRVGKDGRLFTLYKFRTMYLDADKRGPAITVQNDPRVTRMGRFLRRTKLDELPQLFNVLEGHMSLVGPRPEDPHYVALYTVDQREVLSVRPGLTSPASVEFSSEEGFLGGDNWETVYREQILPRKLAVDLNYLKQRTIWSDLGVLLNTAKIVVFGRAGINAASMLRPEHNWLPYITSLATKVRNRHILLLDICAILLIASVDLPLRLGTLNLSPADTNGLLLFLLAALPTKLLIFYKQGMYNRYWRSAGVDDLLRVALAVASSTAVLTVVFIGLYPVLAGNNLALYRTVPLIDGLLTLLAVAGSRFSVRALHHWYHYHQRSITGQRVLIVGAGETGITALRAIQASPQLSMVPVAFVDDDPHKLGSYIEEIPVIGTTYEIQSLASQYNIQVAVVTLSKAPLRRQQEIMAMCRSCGITPLSLPATYELLAGHKTVSRLPQVDMNRLLGREAVKTDHAEVAAMLKGKTILVTGAGGSIGSELCRQIAQLEPAEILLLGHGENSIFEIGLNLRLTFPDLVTKSLIVDVRDQQRVNWAIEKYGPQVIFHAAAHKHVSFMEKNCEEAVINNVLGTENVLRAAERYGVERFVMVSSDKAVNPSSMMGATKRVAELLVIATAQRSGKAYMSVRFGNVLGSRGSVVPIFQQQIAAGKSLTITDPEMRRYFMTIPEAVDLLLQAAVAGRGGEVFLLDMGEQVRIVDLATKLIRLSGLEPGRDIKIEFGSALPGEKLSEELFLENEKYQRTRYEKIFVSTREHIVDAQTLERMVSELIAAAQRMESQAVLEHIQQIVPEYRTTSAASVVSTPREVPSPINGFQRESALVPAQ